MEISTHTSRVGCDGQIVNSDSNKFISTHTSRVGCDLKENSSRFPYGDISTHTSRVGCDHKAVKLMIKYANFYSHIPCGM